MSTGLTVITSFSPSKSFNVSPALSLCEDDKKEGKELKEAIWALAKAVARPVEAHLNVSGRELARATVEPMADEMVQLDALKKMLRGVK